MPHNVVLICVDQWRGDCLSCAGHPDVHTPTLDGLAMGGTRFAAHSGEVVGQGPS